MLTSALTALLKLPDLLIQALRALIALLEVVPVLLQVWSTKRIEAIHNEIIALESAADPKHRARLGELRVQLVTARKLDEALRAGHATGEKGQPDSND